MSGREEGANFEDLFVRQARRNGLTPIKNYLSAKIGWNGRIILLPSDLDFKLVTPKGVIGYFDCKTFAEDYFTYADIDEDQLERAALYRDLKVPSGFVVFFRQSNEVVFFTARAITLKGPRNRFTSSDGRFLGTYEDFDLRPILKK